MEESSLPLSVVPLSKWEKTSDAGNFSQGKTSQKSNLPSVWSFQVFPIIVLCFSAKTESKWETVGNQADEDKVNVR